MAGELVLSRRVEKGYDHSIIEGDRVDSPLSDLIFQYPIVDPSATSDTTMTPVPKSVNYMCSLRFKNEGDFHKFKMGCSNLKIDERYIKFNETDLSCSVCSPYFLIVMGQRYPSFGTLTGFENATRNPFYDYVKLGDHAVEFGVLPNEKPSYLTTLESQNDFFKTLQEKPHPLNLSESPNDQELITQVFAQNQGLIIGEYRHDEVNPKKFIIDNLETFKNQGVKVLYLEHLLHELIQEDLDDYFTGKPMSTVLEAFLDNQDIGQGVPENYREQYGYKALVKAAKEHGIRVVAIDTADSYYSEKPSRAAPLAHGAARYKAMNHQAQLIIEKDNPNSSQKFIVFAGGAHICKKDGVPGLSEILGCPNVLIADTQGSSESQRDVRELPKENIQGNIDLFIKRPLPQ